MNSDTLKPLFRRACALLGQLRDLGCRFRFSQIPRSRNGDADRLANKAMDEGCSSVLVAEAVLLRSSPVGAPDLGSPDESVLPERVSATRVAEHPPLWEFIPKGCEDLWVEASRPFFQAYLCESSWFTWREG